MSDEPQPPIVTPPRRPPEAPNPLYLMSALSMLSGCYLLNFDLIQGREHLSEIATLVGVLQLYEGALLGAAGYLFATGRSLRDARTLLVLEVPFLVDATYFLAESFEFAPGAAWALNVAAAALVAVKLWVLERTLRLGFRRRELAFLAIGFAALLGFPGLLAAALRGDGVSPALLSTAWWAVAAAIAFEPGGGARERPGLAARTLDRERVADTFRFALRVGLVVSLAAHLRSSYYVYELPPHLASLAPLLVAAAFRVLRSPGARDGAAGRAALFGLPLLAILLASRAPTELTGVLAGVELGPYRLVLLASGALYLEAVRRLHRRYFLAAAIGTVTLASLGSTPRTLGERIGRVATDGVELFWRGIPRTMGDWGFVGIVTAFILLGAGVMLTLARNPRTNGGPGRNGWSANASAVK